MSESDIQKDLFLIQTNYLPFRLQLKIIKVGMAVSKGIQTMVVGIHSTALRLLYSTV